MGEIYIVEKQSYDSSSRCEAVAAFGDKADAEDLAARMSGWVRAVPLDQKYRDAFYWVAWKSPVNRGCNCGGKYGPVLELPNDDYTHMTARFFGWSIEEAKQKAESAVDH